MRRRTFLTQCARLTAAAALARPVREAIQAQTAAENSGGSIVVDPKPLFEISPLLFMQFMEPLGVTDSSVEASWSYDRDDWREDFIATSKELAPDVVRFGGLFSRYYKWREGVGPAARRPWMRNYVWGGKETNRVGTHEFVDYCRRVGAKPLYCVNFQGDGFERFARTPEGDRTGGAQEAADWVSYANDPDHAGRKAHGHSDPYDIKLWQLGNETSYGKGGFTKDQSIAATIEFATAMRARDAGIQLIGWADSGWAGNLSDRAGHLLDYAAVHMMGQSPLRKNSVLGGFEYQEAPERAWEELLELFPERVEKKLLAVEAELDGRKSKLPIAITEGHLSLAPQNANPILTEWLTGVYHARALNLYQRHGARVRICTAADFNGTRWTTNALLLGVPGGPCYLHPAGAVMSLFKRHNGRHGVGVKSAPSALDIAASWTDGKIFLHVANTDYARSVESSFAVEGMTVLGGKVFEIAPEKPRQEISHRNPEVFNPREKPVADAPILRWRFPARSVSAVELQCAG
jgi:alpha-N-arabinofuranosidase